MARTFSIVASGSRTLTGDVPTLPSPRAIGIDDGSQVILAQAAEAGLTEDTPIGLTLKGDGRVIEPVEPEKITLEGLLAGMREDNLHAEIPTGPAAGREAW